MSESQLRSLTETTAARLTHLTQENASGRVTRRMDKRLPTQLVRNCPLPSGLHHAFNNVKGLFGVLKLVPASKTNVL